MAAPTISSLSPASIQAIVPGGWAPGYSYVVGTQVFDPAGHIQQVITAGTSGTGPAQPAWNDAGGTTTDGTVVWQDEGNVGLTITVNGTGFVTGQTVVYWGYQPLPTIFVSAVQVTAAVPYRNLAGPSVPLITVQVAGVTSATQALPGVPFYVTTALDLTTVPIVKSWLGANGIASLSVTDDDNIQRFISEAGVDWLRMCGRGPMNGAIPAASPFNSFVQYQNELYDGNGNLQMFLRNFPVQSVQSLIVQGQQIPQSKTTNGVQGPGFFVNSDGRSLIIVGGGYGVDNVYGVGTGYGGGAYTVFSVVAGLGAIWCFIIGKANVQVSYTAGFPFLPYDIERACTRMIGAYIKRRGWIDQASQSMGNGAGSIRYRDWAIEPAVMEIINYYRREIQ